MCGFVHGLYGCYQLLLGVARSRCQKSSLCCSRCVRRCAVRLLGSPSVVWLGWCIVLFSICTWDDSISCGFGELGAICSGTSVTGGMFCCFVCWRFVRRAVVGGASPSGFATGGLRKVPLWGRRCFSFVTFSVVSLLVLVALAFLMYGKAVRFRTLGTW